MTTSYCARSPSPAWPVLAFLVATAAACGSVTDAHPLADGGTQVPTDGPPPDDRAPAAARCDPAKPFAAPTPVAGVNTADDEIGFTLTRDELVGFVSRVAQDTAPRATMLTTRRARLADPFATPTPDATRALNDVAGEELLPFPSGDGLILYFSRVIGGGDPQLMIATRASAGAAFGAEAQLLVEGAAVPGSSAVLSGDGETLYWVDPTITLHSASRLADPGEFVTQLDLSGDEVARAVLSADELTLYYANSAVAGLLVATRASRTARFGAGAALPGLDSIAGDAPVFLTADGCVLYLKSNRPGGLGGDDLWQAARPR
jgi:hypothetical protein